MPPGELLRVEGLTVGRRGGPALVRELDLTVASGERWALLGASGAGKSLTAMAVLDLLPPPLVRLAGSVRVAGIDPAGAPEEQRRRLRGGVVGLALQEPAAALNPVLSVGFQLRETVRAHGAVTCRESARRAVELLEAVGLEPAREMLRAYPHQLSGGQLQRAMLALALSGSPSLLVADEPTTALDPVTRGEILTLLERLAREDDLALLLISHDLDAVRRLAERVLVMYAGEVVEETTVTQLLADPLHPYARLLVDLARRGAGRSQTTPVAPAGCAFAPGCTLAAPTCSADRPRLEPTGDGRRVRCPRTAPGGAR